MTTGYIFIALAFIASVVSATAYYLYYREKQESLFTLANRSFMVMTGSIATALAMLVYAIITHNFQLNYVYSYSSTDLPNRLLFATLWAGQEGTFLMWLFYGAIYGIILIKSSARKRPLVMFFLLLVQAFLLLILLKKNPFMMIWHIHETVPIGFMPVEGAGLNPLLQNPWMVIHPPTLFVGYSSTMVPFAFAMSAMITRDYKSWVKEARPWILFNVMVLGTGIVMGGYWAYTTLGWGGYWGWDPVENASLVPWLFSLVLLHGSIVQARRNSLVKTNLFMAGMAFLTMLWGSYLTRSGVLTDFSVHSFAPSGLSFYLILFQGFFTGLFFYLIAKFSWHLHKADEQPVKIGDKIFNRESFMLMGMMTLFLTALFVLFGTSAPLYTGWLGTASSLSPDFYNTMIVPVVICMLIFLGIAPLLAWKTAELRNIPTILRSAGGAVLLSIIAVLLGLTHPASIALFFLSVFVILINGKITFLFLRRNTTNAGGYLAHVGLALMVIGIITSSIYDTREKVLLPAGQFHKTDMGYEIKFIGFKDMPDGKDRAQLIVKSDYGTYQAEPQFYYSDYSQAYMVSPDVKVEFAKDIYISPISFTPAALANQQEIELRKMETGAVGDLKITFNKFLVNMSGNSQEVTADLDVAVTENSYEKVSNVAPMLIAENGKMSSREAEVPGTPYRVKLTSVSATEGKIKLAVLFPQADSETPRDILAVEVSQKPLISILWFGTIIFIIGAFMSLINRIKTSHG